MTQGQKWSLTIRALRRASIGKDSCIRFAIIVATLGALPALATPTEVLPPKSTWEYTFTDPSVSDPNWTTTTGIGGIWQSGDALFGNVPSTENGDFDFATFPPADTVRDDYDLWVRRSVDFSAFDIATAVRELGVDIGFLLYANGVFIDGDNREHFTERGEYSGDFGSALVPGENVIAVAVDDFGLLTAFDMRITAEAATILPLPSGLPLLLGGLGGLELLRRRRS